MRTESVPEILTHRALTALGARDLHVGEYHDLSAFNQIKPGAIHVLTHLLDDDTEFGTGYLRLSGLKTLSVDLAEALGMTRISGLDLSGLLDLTPQAARALVQNPYPILDLSGLKSISVPTARALAVHVGPLNLSGLETITRDVAAILSEHAGLLNLSGLRDLPSPALQALGHGTSSLLLGGLKHLPLDSISVLAKKREILDLSGLDELSESAARLLSQHNSPEELLLNGVYCLGSEVATILADRTGSTSLASCKNLTDKSFEALANAKLDKKARINLSGLDRLTTHQCAVLKKTKARLDLGGLIELSPELAEGLLATKSQVLEFHRLEHLSSDTARVLVQFPSPGITLQEQKKALAHATARMDVIKERFQRQPWLDQCVGLSFRALTDLEAETAKVLGQGQDFGIDLSGVTRFSLEAIQGMAAGSRFWRLWGLISLTPEMAQAIAESKGLFDISRVKSLTPEVVATLQNHRCALHLPDVTEISPATAKELVHCKANGIYLRGVRELEPEAIELLAQYPGTPQDPIDTARICLGNLRNLSVEEHVRLLENPHIDIGIDGLTELAPKIASICVRRQAVQLNFPSTVTQLEVEAAQNLLEHGSSPFCGKYSNLQLPGLRKLTEPLAHVLSQYPRALLLPGIESLSDECAQILSTHEGGRLDLGGIPQITNSSIVALAKHRGQLRLRGLRSLSSEGAEALSKHPFPLHLQSVEQLSAEAVEHLAKHRPVLNQYQEYLSERDEGFFLLLTGLKELSDRAAEFLSTQPLGRLHLGFCRVSDRALRLLARNRNIRLFAIPEILERYFALGGISGR